ncbi:MAG: hypothetical protein QHJ73_10910, partial [Armatimonadota bacterium]|nr:hypothetical protein [Armatimonadota bacterium]
MEGTQIPSQGQVPPAGLLPGPAAVPYGWDEPRFELRDYIWMVIKRRRIIVLTFVGIMAAAGFYVTTAPRVYRSTAKVRILQPPTPPTLELMLPNTTKTPEFSLKTESKVAQSSLTLEEAARYLLATDPKIVTDPRRADLNRARLLHQQQPEPHTKAEQRWLDSEEGLRALHATRREIQSSLRVVAEEPDVLAIQAEHTDPERAALIANAAQIAYLQESRRTAQAEVTAQEEFLTKRIAEAKNDLEAVERAVREFKEKHNLTRSDQLAEAEARAVMEDAAEAERMRAEVRAAESELASLKARLKYTKPLRRAMRVVNDPVAENYRKQIAEAEGELLRVQAEHPDNHPLVVSRRAQLNELLRQFETRFGKRLSSFQLEEIEEPNPAYETLVGQIDALESRLAGMRAKADALATMARTRQAALPDHPQAYVELARLEHERDLREQIWLRLQEELQRT